MESEVTLKWHSNSRKPSLQNLQLKRQLDLQTRLNIGNCVMSAPNQEGRSARALQGCALEDFETLVGIYVHLCLTRCLTKLEKAWLSGQPNHQLSGVVDPSVREQCEGLAGRS